MSTGLTLCLFRIILKMVFPFWRLYTKSLPVGGGLLSHSAFSIICLAILSALHCSRFCWINCWSSVLQEVMRSWYVEGEAMLVKTCMAGFLTWTPVPSVAWNGYVISHIAYLEVRVLRFTAYFQKTRGQILSYQKLLYKESCYNTLTSD